VVAHWYPDYASLFFKCRLLMHKISIIIPVLNEQSALIEHLPVLQDYRHAGHEVIVVDGGSTDASVSIASALADQVLKSSPGRSVQMNAGAARAAGTILLFLHIDTLLPAHADRILTNHLSNSDRVWGRFDLKLTGSSSAFRVIEWMINLRSRYTGMATGDQAIFVLSSVFQQAGAYPEIPLMEDVALSRKLRKFSRPVCLRQRVITSSRRWEQHGIVRTTGLMWILRLGFFFGVSPTSLHRKYYKKTG
jgi:rSAM/selenodomain-associated transferase 2